MAWIIVVIWVFIFIICLQHDGGGIGVHVYFFRVVVGGAPLCFGHCFSEYEGSE